MEEERRELERPTKRLLEFPGGPAGKASSIVSVVAWVIALAQVRSLTRELLHAMGVVKKKKKRLLFQMRDTQIMD